MTQAPCETIYAKRFEQIPFISRHSRGHKDNVRGRRDDAQYAFAFARFELTGTNGAAAVRQSVGSPHEKTHTNYIL